MKLNIINRRRAFQDSRIAYNNQLLPQNTNAGLESESTDQPHLDIEQGQGILALEFIHLTLEASNRKPQTIYAPTHKAQCDFNLRKTTLEGHVVWISMLIFSLFLRTRIHLFCFFVTETHRGYFCIIFCTWVSLYGCPSPVGFFPLILLCFCLHTPISNSFYCQLPASFSHNIK